MLRRLLSAAALLALLASAAHAQGGINLYWNSCQGAPARTFACNTNSGNSFVFGSFVAPYGVTAMSANEIVIDVLSSNVAIPQWWELKNAGACRPNALSVSFDATTDVSGNCADYWQGQAVGGIGAYQVLSPFKRRIIAVGAVPPSAVGPLEAGTEYFSFRIAINHSASTGSGSCAGCLEPVCLVLNSIKLTQPVGVGDFLLYTPAVNNCVSWQGGLPQCCFVPTRSRTWGSVKALYR